ncbi:MAG: glycosyltransferase family A protein [Lutibacter sp.]
MRIGFNPNKDKLIESTDFFHQVVVPVFIPNEEGYFKDSFQILQVCLNSLFKTSHSKTYFTVVNNGSCAKVVAYLNQLYEENKIHEIIHTGNIGKLNAILKGITGQQFSLITITDADVLFLNNWQEATYEVFKAFPKVGAVSTTPSSKVLKQHTQNIVASNLFSSKLRFTKVIDPNALKMFANSIGNDLFYNEVHLNKQLTISSKMARAVVGAGHFVATYRGCIFDELQARYTLHALGGSSESSFLDKPVADLGYWRLSTEVNYTAHLGNVIESWMQSSFETINEKNEPVNDLKFLNYAKPKTTFVFLNKIIFKLLLYPPIWKSFLKYKGLTQEEANKY